MAIKNQFVEKTANTIIEALKNGTAPWLKPWKGQELKANSPYNGASEKAYIGINNLSLSLIALQKGYNSPRWFTYNQARVLNARVKRGEKASLVQHWIFEEKRDKLDKDGNKILNRDGKVETEIVKLARPKVVYHNVFNENQIDNIPKITVSVEQLTDFEINEAAENILKNSGANISNTEENRAYYNSQKDEIHLPKKENFISEGAYYACALHELGHWTGHETRLDRDLANPFGSTAYAKEELRAEIGSFLLSSHIGIDYDPGQHMSYISSWVSILEDKPNEIFKASADATRILNYVKKFELKNEQIEDIKIESEKNTPTKERIDEMADISKVNTILHVPFAEKNEAKKLGAKWNKNEKTWYAPAGFDLNNFSRWRSEIINIESNSNVMVIESIDNLKDVFNKLDIDIPDNLLMDGAMHRASLQHDSRDSKKDCAYIIYNDTTIAGWVKNWTTGEKVNFIVNNKINYSVEQRDNVAAQNIELLKKRDEEKIQLQLKTAAKLENEFNNAKWSYNQHPYLKSKGLEKNYYTKQDERGNILIPLSDIDGKLWTTQRIFSDGTKTNGVIRTKEEKDLKVEYSARKKGCFFIVGAKEIKNLNPIIITEGFATAASVYEATKNPTITAVDAGNIKFVVEAIREKYPNKEIIIAGDNDIAKEMEGKPNVGKETALAVASEYNIKVVYPTFNSDEQSKKLSDFNDLANSRGLNEVKKQLSIASLISRQQREKSKQIGMSI